MIKLLKFDIEKAKTGEYSIVTRCGDEIRQLVWFKDATRDNYTLCAVVRGCIRKWELNGSYNLFVSHDYDLFLIKK